jgi:hypothetical protein
VVAGAILAARDGAGESLQGSMLALAIVAVVWGVVFYYLVLRRRRWVSELTDRLQRRGAGAQRLARLLSIEDDPGAGYHALADLPMNTRAALALATGVGGALFFAAWFAPVATGWLFGGIVLFFIAAGSWIPLGSALVYVANRTGLPVLLGLFALAVVFSLWNDNHTLRASDSTLDPAARPTVDAAARAWLQANASETAPAPLVIVATAGGGSRAAYWTATVLGQAADEIPGLEQRLFAISGVSGGSVGATVFRTLLEAPAGPRCRDAGGEPSDSLRRCAQAVIGRDFLGPVLAGALYTDLTQRFLPLPHPYVLPDRARALEFGWEAAYTDTVTEPGEGLGGSLLALYAEQTAEGEGSWPALFLNGTWVQHGRRLIASNLALEPTAADNDAFITAYDLLARLGSDLPRSTAADISARFPGVGPGGTLRDPESGEIWGRVVDGGYFENFGAVTAQEILDTVMGEARALGVAVRPIVVQISSDPELPPDVQGLADPAPIGLGYEIRAPLKTLFATRTARGILATETLRKHVEAAYAAERGRFLQFRMCQEPGVTDPPLGWTLSDSARARIDSYLPADPEAKRPCEDNLEAMRNLRALLGG